MFFVITQQQIHKNIWKIYIVLLPRLLFDNLGSSTAVTQSYVLRMGSGREEDHLQQVPAATGE